MRARSAVSSLPLLVAIIAASLFGLACGREPAERPKLVLLISVDTLRRDALRAYDPTATPLPSVDAFAAESVRFERATSVASWTLPAHATLLTGLQPDRHGATDPRVGIAADAPTLAERFRDAGYETVGITHGGYLDRRYGMGRGFDRYSDAPARAATAADAQHSVFDEAAALLRDRSDARPLFLFLQTYSVHDYFLLRPWAVEQLDAKPPKQAAEYVACLQGTRRCDAEEWQLLERLYAIELRNFDAGFGRLRAALAEKGLASDAVVVLTTDHGEGFDPARRRIHHGGRLHEDVIRIPLLVHGPGFAPRAVATPASLVDLMPTLLGIAAIEPPPGLDGVSLLPLLRGGAESSAARPLFAVEHYASWWMDSRTRATEVQPRPLSVAVIEGDRWYLRAGKREEVYDVASDPHQAHDLSASAPDLEALRALAGRREVDRAESAPIDGTDELRERLRALGYAE